MVCSMEGIATFREIDSLYWMCLHVFGVLLPSIFAIRFRCCRPCKAQLHHIVNMGYECCGCEIDVYIVMKLTSPGINVGGC